MLAQTLRVATVDRATVTVVAIRIDIAAVTEEVDDVQSAGATGHAAVVAANVNRDEQAGAASSHAGLERTLWLSLIRTGTATDAVGEQILRRTAGGVRYVGDQILRLVVAIREEVDQATVALR